VIFFLKNLEREYLLIIFKGELMGFFYVTACIFRLEFVMNEIIIKIIELIFDKIAWIVLLSTVILLRKPLGSLIEKLSNIYFKNKDTTLSMNTAEGVEPEDTNINDEEVVEESDSSVKEINEKKSNVEDASTDEPWLERMIDCFKNGNIDEAKDLFKTGIRTEEKDKQDKTEAIYLYCLYKYDSPDEKLIEQLLELIEKTDDETSKFKIMQWLSFCFQSSNDDRREIDFWQNSYSQFSKDENKIDCLVRWSKALMKNEDLESARDLIKRNINAFSSKDKATLYRHLKHIEEKDGNKRLASFCLDKAVELDVSNPRQIFKAAYNDDITIDRRLSVANYDKLLRIDPNYDYAINNLGVAARNENFNYKAIQLYKKAGEIGVSLSLVNKANILLEAGFIDEAEEIAKDVLKVDDHHSNVYSLLDDITKKRKKEKKGWQDYRDNCLAFQRQIRKYTNDYYSEDNPSLFDNSWSLSKEYVINIEVKNDKLELTWEIGDFDYKISCDITGCSIKGTYSKMRKEDKYYTSPNITYGVYGYISKNRLIIFPQDKNEYETLTFESLDENKEI
jgi:tetratricopeptide (TPR) repeat protein